MVKRLISATASEIRKMSAKELLQSIKASEGRVIVSENVTSNPPAVGSATSAELAVAFSADLLLLNAFDCFNPIVVGLPGMDMYQSVELFQHPEKNKQNPVETLKQLTGRPIGINLEPVAKGQALMSEAVEISNGRISTPETFEQAEKLGVDFICLTGNPGTGVTNKEITEAIKVGKKHYSGIIIAGKMHSSGVDEPIMTEEAVRSFAEAGADILLLPAVGTVPGFDQEASKAIVQIAKSYGMLTMSSIGTSQESASPETIRQIALWNKVCGVDLQHIGDAGYGGLAPAENIYHLSVAIRGMRHTLEIMARSINR